MEAGDPSVSEDLLVRSLITLWTSDRELSQIIATTEPRDWTWRRAVAIGSVAIPNYSYKLN